MAEQVFKAVVNDTDPSSGGKSYPIDISGSNYNHFLGKKIGDSVDGIFVGATRSRDMRNMMFVSFVIYALAVLCLLPFLDNHGLWMALLVSFVARGLTLGLRYRTLEQAALH